jgi:GTP:adenosylcobinamide-phosphate guanylyltransferase
MPTTPNRRSTLHVVLCWLPDKLLDEEVPAVDLEKKASTTKKLLSSSTTIVITTDSSLYAEIVVANVHSLINIAMDLRRLPCLVVVSDIPVTKVDMIHRIDEYQSP